jgi:hypothetical protein
MLVLPAELPFHLAQMNAGNGVGSLPSQTSWKPGAVKIFLLEQVRNIADCINYAFDPDASTPRGLHFVKSSFRSA